MTHKIIKTDDYLLVADDKDKDFYAYDYGLYKNYKLGLVTDCNDDVLEFEGECIDESNLSKVIAHLPLTELPILKGVPLLPPYSRHQKDGLEQLANTMFRNKIDSLEEIHSDYILGVTEGYNKAREKYKYTEEDVRKAIKMVAEKCRKSYYMVSDVEIIQSLNQYPTEFECEMETIWVRNKDRNAPTKDDFEYEPKTITTAQGIQWVGKYK